jgi:hypothetical protein
MDKYKENLYAKITEAAQLHGQDSEPEHEVGDLQDALRISIDQMFPDQVERLEKEWDETHNV